ncbi:MAG: hypothetical protein QXV32_07155, partial [Conexivisphaerales archaeon]
MRDSKKYLVLVSAIALVVLVVSSSFLRPELERYLTSAYSAIENVMNFQRHEDDNTPLRIAVVKPVFTTTAYSSYYTFFQKYAHHKGVVRGPDLALLNTSVVDGWGWSTGLVDFIKSDYARQQGFNVTKNAFLLTDINITEGAL